MQAPIIFPTRLNLASRMFGIWRAVTIGSGQTFRVSCRYNNTVWRTAAAKTIAVIPTIATTPPNSNSRNWRPRNHIGMRANDHVSGDQQNSNFGGAEQTV